MKTVFLLEHYYEDTIDEDITSGETKTLGIFSTEEKAKEAIQFYKVLPGFKDYPDDCFNVEEFELDDKWWDTGFVTVEGIFPRKKPETPEDIEYVKECIRNSIREKQEEIQKLQEDLKKYEA
jgi:hypothetical protein